MEIVLVVFFSSRRRHTRLRRDWSSDVCSSDLLTSEANVLLSAVARVGREGEAVSAAFQAATEEWGSSERWTPSLLEADDCVAERLEVALNAFEASTPLLKKQILRMCGLAAAQDGILTSAEAELLRTVADAMGASLPPFVWKLKNQDQV